SVFKVYQESICSSTQERLQFLDITGEVSALVRRSGVRYGLVNVQSLHTTAAIIVNEHEPLLIEDMKRVLERIAPRTAAYRHDDFTIRTVNMCPEEEKNGHSHCKAMFLTPAATLNVVDGRLRLGTWQRIFLVELDEARSRTVSVMVIGNQGDG